MRFLVPAVPVALLLGCAAAPQQDAAADCAAQGFTPGTEPYRVCMDAGGVGLATGPGSPYALSNND